MKNNEFLYNKVIDYIMDIIKRHPDEQDYKLPSERQLEIKLGVSSITVKNALKKLEERGLIVRQQGRGSFIKPRGLTATPQNVPVYNILVSLNSINSYFINQIIVGIRDFCMENNINCFFTANFNNKTSENNAIKSLKKLKYDGLIIFPVDDQYYSKSVLEAVISNLPVVMIDRESQGVQASFISSDHYNITYKTVNNLISQGITDILLILPISYNITSINNRHRAYLDAFINNGQVINRKYILDKYFDSDTSEYKYAASSPLKKEQLEKWSDFYIKYLSENPQIKAIITINGISFLAMINAVKILKNRGYPADYKIYVFDDDFEEVGFISDIPFTTLRQNGYKIGNQAAQQLYGLITHSTTNKKIEIDFLED